MRVWDQPPHLSVVHYRGVELKAVKNYFRGTQRSVPPEETLRRISPLFPAAGITRLADITGLDTVGIPVTLAIRPNGRTLSSSAGKGMTLEAALVSAAMESLELHHAEEWSPVAVRRSYEEISDEFPVPDPEDLPLSRAAPFPPDWPYLWTFGWDVLSQEEVAVPVSMIHMGNRTSRIFDLFSFQVTSSGLASGNNLAEALHAALSEVIERDAATCRQERWDAQRTPPPVLDPDAVELPAVRELLDRLRKADVGVLLFDCTVDTRVPVYMADIFDRTRQVDGTYRGYGAHLDPEIALTRALTEAVQARTVHIAGSRDDIFRNRDLHTHAHADHEYERMLSMADGTPPVVAGRPGASEATATFEGDICLMLERLRAVGIQRVIVVDLSRPGSPISVVKVVVPGLEGYRMENYAPGRRARRFAQSSAIGVNS
ncbi:YcaO-like family protein [Kitasatospora sp. NPDC057541]|uniref:YcaO-like family protein n=1 Tax=unclassified Kitasatospora TaxID=2633591 RepID=UPI0036C4013B